jgi:hypothetical protein
MTTSANHQLAVLLQNEKKLESALALMWNFASEMVYRHGESGDNTMTADDQVQWDEAAHATADLIPSGGSISSDPWHLFCVFASGPTGFRTFLVTGQSESESKADELVRAAVDDFLPEGWLIVSSSKVCMAGRDIWQEMKHPG